MFVRDHGQKPSVKPNADTVGKFLRWFENSRSRDKRAANTIVLPQKKNSPCNEQSNCDGRNLSVGYAFTIPAGIIVMSPQHGSF